MSVRIGAALRRELPALEELRTGDPALPESAGEELALRVPVPPRPRRPSMAHAPPRPSARSMGSLLSATARLTEPGGLDALGEAAGPVRDMVLALEELLALGRAVELARKLGVRA